MKRNTNERPLTDEHGTNSNKGHLIENTSVSHKSSSKKVIRANKVMLSPTKAVDTTPMIPRNDPMHQKNVKRAEHGMFQPKDLLKTSQGLGLLRKGDTLVPEDVYSPLKIHDATITGVRESLGHTFINRSDNQTFGDLTLDPNATSFIIHESSHDEERHEKSVINESKTHEKSKKDPVKVPFLSGPTEDHQQDNAKHEIPAWLQETNVQQYPYNFMTALQKKLAAAVKATQSPVNAPVKQDMRPHGKYQRMAFVNDKREYESCTFTEIVPDKEQQKLPNEIPKVENVERQEMGRSRYRSGKGKRIVLY